MLSNIGNIFVIGSLLTCLLIFYYGLINNSLLNSLKYNRLIKISLYQTTFVIMSFITLITGYLLSDFSLSNVFENSHSQKPIFYKVSGTWGNHEGSLLLWINILVIFSYLFLVLNKDTDKKFKIYTLIVQNTLIFGFLLFLIFNSNPFSIIVPTPKEGMGLNPILQDPALAIHPPLLYVGFVGSSIYFSAAIASLLTSFEGVKFAKSIRPWIVVSWCFQTLGIIVGSIWAYYELGWGGFWFWDPVENSSLMPWFAMTALMHSIIVLEKRNSLYSWVIVLCISTFLFSVTGTFLVRSGILNSVHTFANDSSRGLYILIFLSLMIFFSIFIYLKKIKKETYNFKINSRETYILTNNWFMAFYLFTIFIGTVYPIFTEVLNNTKISVGPPFYNIVIFPLVVPFLIFMSLAPTTKWISNKFKNYYKLLLVLIFSVIFNYLIIYFFKNYSLISNLVIISSIFLILYSVIDLYKTVKIKKYLDVSRITSHLGFGLMIFFIIINHNFTIEKDFNLKVGEKRKFENFNIHFESLRLVSKENYNSLVGTFNIQNLKTTTQRKLNPEIRIYEQPQTTTYEAGIRSRFSEDIYITMSNINRSDLFNIKFQKKPFMFCIWLSAFLISVGGFLRLFKNENKF